MMKNHDSRVARQKNATTSIHKRKERGSGLLEQALVLITLLAVLFGIIDFGRALYTYHFVSNSAREASRWASVRSLTSALPGAPADDTSVNQQFFTNLSGMGLDPSKINAKTTFVAPPNPGPVCTPPKNNPGCVVQVSVSYAYKFMFPFLPTSTVNMTSRSQMVITQ